MNGLFAKMKTYVAEIAMLEAELREGLSLFWNEAAGVLGDGSIHLVPPDEETFSLARNFFSTLFLYSYYRVGIPAERRVLYAAINQCLRGMVTGCDNLLDDEYKMTLQTNLPGTARRFRSVLDIMVADRVLFALVHNYCACHQLPAQLTIQASSASLRALTESGAQEATEEGGVDRILPPEQVLREVHHYKTGLLFNCTWTIPSLLEGRDDHEIKTVKNALYGIGIGCQILDDIVDLFTDVRDKRHNYVASVIAHREPPGAWGDLLSAVQTGGTAADWYRGRPELTARIKDEAEALLNSNLKRLFFDAHQELVRPAAQFIAERIGVSIP